MNITFDIPTDIAEALRPLGPDPVLAVKESALVEFYRQRRITHHQLGSALGLNRYEVDGVLKRHKVELDFSAEQFNAEATSLASSAHP